MTTETKSPSSKRDAPTPESDALPQIVKNGLVYVPLEDCQRIERERDQVLVPKQGDDNITGSRAISGVTREDFEEALGVSDHGCATNAVVDHGNGSVSGEQLAKEEKLYGDFFESNERTRLETALAESRAEVERLQRTEEKLRSSIGLNLATIDQLIQERTTLREENTRLREREKAVFNSGRYGSVADYTYWLRNNPTVPVEAGKEEG